MTQPGLTNIAVVQRGPGDLAVRFERADGGIAEVSGADCHLDGKPFATVVEVFGFLFWQEPALPVELVQRALDTFDPSWEKAVAAHKRANDEASARARGELTPREAEAQRRNDLKARWRERPSG